MFLSSDQEKIEISVIQRDPSINLNILIIFSPQKSNTRLQITTTSMSQKKVLKLQAALRNRPISNILSQRDVTVFVEAGTLNKTSDF